MAQKEVTPDTLTDEAMNTAPDTLTDEQMGAGTPDTLTDEQMGGGASTQLTPQRLTAEFVGLKPYIDIKEQGLKKASGFVGTEDVPWTGKLTEDIPKFTESMMQNAFLPFSWAVKNISQEIAIKYQIIKDAIVGNVDTHDVDIAKNTELINSKLGLAMNAIGFAAGVFNDYRRDITKETAGVIQGKDFDANKLNIFNRIVDNFTNNKTIGQSLVEEAKDLGIPEDSLAGMFVSLTAQGVDLAATVGTFKLMLGAKGQYNKMTTDAISELTNKVGTENIKLSGEAINKLAGEQAVKDAIDNTIKQKTMDVKIAADDWGSIDQIKELPTETPMEKWTKDKTQTLEKQEAQKPGQSQTATLSYDNLFELDKVIDEVKKEVAAEDATKNIPETERKAFAENINNMYKSAHALDEVDMGIMKRSYNVVKNTIKGTYDDAKYFLDSKYKQPFRFVINRFDKMAEGSEVARLLEEYPRAVDRHAAESIAELNNYKFKEVWDRKRNTNLIRAVQGKEKLMDKYNSDLSAIMRRGYDKTWGKAANKYGIKVTNPGDGTTTPLKDHYLPNYDYRMVDYNLSKENQPYRDINIDIIKNKAKVTTEVATKILDDMIEKADAEYGSAGRNGSLHFAREFGLEGYDNNAIRNYIKYQQASAQEFASIDLFGKDQVKLKEMLDKVSNANEIKIQDVQKMFNSGIGQHSLRELSDINHLKRFKDFENVRHLWFSGLGNIQELAQSAKYDVFSGLKDVLMDPKTSKQFTNDCGASVAVTMQKMANMGTFMGEFFQKNKFQLTQFWTENLAANSAKRSALRLFDEYKNNQPSVEDMKLYSQHILMNKKIFHETPANAVRVALTWNKISKAGHAMKALEDLGIDAKGALKDGGLSYDDLLNAGQRGAEFGSDKPSHGKMTVWGNTPAGQSILMWRGWAAARYHNMMKLYVGSWKEFKSTGDPRAFKPIIKLAVANGISTAVTDTLRKAIQGKPLTVDDHNRMIQFMEYMGMMTLGPIWVNYLTAIAWGAQGIFKAASGPLISDAVEAVDKTGQVIKKAAK